VTLLPDFTTFRLYFGAVTATVDDDGYETWPVALVRANGFDGGFTGIPRPITSFPLTISINGGAVDGGNAFDWYLSQRTDDPTSQYLSIAHPSAMQSGTVVLSITAHGAVELGLTLITDPVNEDQVREALKHCTLYVRRKSDSAIQGAHLLRDALSNF
jgi:hypothetical protein